MSEVQKAQWSLINQNYDKICNVLSYSNFRTNTFCASFQKLIIFFMET